MTKPSVIITAHQSEIWLEIFQTLKHAVYRKMCEVIYGAQLIIIYY